MTSSITRHTPRPRVAIAIARPLRRPLHRALGFAACFFVLAAPLRVWAQGLPATIFRIENVPVLHPDCVNLVPGAGATLVIAAPIFSLIALFILWPYHELGLSLKAKRQLKVGFVIALFFGCLNVFLGFATSGASSRQPAPSLGERLPGLTAVYANEGCANVIGAPVPFPAVAAIALLHLALVAGLYIKRREVARFTRAPVPAASGGPEPALSPWRPLASVLAVCTLAHVVVAILMVSAHG